MTEQESNLHKEIQALKGEVRRLRQMVECGFVVIGLAAAIIVPQLAVLILAVTALAVFAFLVSPVRKLIFEYLFSNRNSGGQETNKRSPSFGIQLLSASSVGRVVEAFSPSYWLHRDSRRVSRASRTRRRCRS